MTYGQLRTSEEILRDIHALPKLVCTPVETTDCGTCNGVAVFDDDWCYCSACGAEVKNANAAKLIEELQEARAKERNAY
jgi:hypothetical protein